MSDTKTFSRHQIRRKKSKMTRGESTRRGRIRFQHVLFTGFVLLVGMVMGVVLFAYFVGGEIYEYRATMDQTTVRSLGLPKVDVIVCLAGGKGRIREAGDLWYQYWKALGGKRGVKEKLPTLYISGMGRKANWRVLTQQISPEVLEALKPQNVFIENESQNTEENADVFAKNAEKKSWRRLALITASYHLPRAHYIFDRTLRQTLAQKTPDAFRIETRAVSHNPFNSERWYSDLTGIRITIMEYLKWQYYRVVWKQKDWTRKSKAKSG